MFFAPQLLLLFEELNYTPVVSFFIRDKMFSFCPIFIKLLDILSKAQGTSIFIFGIRVVRYLKPSIFSLTWLGKDAIFLMSFLDNHFERALQERYLRGFFLLKFCKTYFIKKLIHRIKLVLRCFRDQFGHSF